MDWQLMFLYALASAVPLVRCYLLMLLLFLLLFADVIAVIMYRFSDVPCCVFFVSCSHRGLFTMLTCLTRQVKCLPYLYLAVSVLCINVH